MAEVWHFDECLIRRGTSSTGSRIDLYAEDVNVELNRTLKECVDPETGRSFDRIATAQEASMNIGMLWGGDFAIDDGIAIRLWFSSSAGTVTYEMGSTYWTKKGWSMRENELVKKDLSFVGASFGTV